MSFVYVQYINILSQNRLGCLFTSSNILFNTLEIGWKNMHIYITFFVWTTKIELLKYLQIEGSFIEIYV